MKNCEYVRLRSILKSLKDSVSPCLTGTSFSPTVLCDPFINDLWSFSDYAGTLPTNIVATSVIFVPTALEQPPVRSRHISVSSNVSPTLLTFSSPKRKFWRTPRRKIKLENWYMIGYRGYRQRPRRASKRAEMEGGERVESVGFVRGGGI